MRIDGEFTSLIDLSDTERLERRWLAEHIVADELVVADELEANVVEGPRGLPPIDWEGTGVAHLVPVVLDFPSGQSGRWEDRDPLPKADVVVMTWTSAEWDALHYVFSNALAPLPNNRADHRWRRSWYPYRRDFFQVFQTLWVRRLISGERNRSRGAPALSRAQMRWGSFCLVRIGEKTVLLFKSELHINQDGEGLPLVQLTNQIIDDCQPELILSVGTSGGVDPAHGLGDTVVSNAGKFRLGDEFESASFNGATFASTWAAPTGLLDVATELLMPVPEFPVIPPCASYGDVRIEPTHHEPRIHIEERPILTTDFFEYGTTTNELWKEGCCVEMDDAVIAMVCDQRAGPQYGFLRNVSDPVIDGRLPRQLQTGWAVATYQLKGLHTSFNSAIATWAMIAGGERLEA